MMDATPLTLDAVPLSGVTLIEASAGTGKTYTLAALFVRLLLESELSVDQILVVTYTRAATAELRVRIRKRIGQTLEALDGAEDLEDPVLARLVEQARETGQSARKRALLGHALAAFDEAAIFTIHGFCQRVLKRHAVESGAAFDAELSEDQGLLVEELVCDFWASRLAGESEGFVAALDSHDLTIERLLRFVRRALPNPQLAIVPAPSRIEQAELERTYLAARGLAAQLWAAESTALTRLLLESGLHATHYNANKLHQTYAPILQQLATLPAAALPDWLSKLTPEGLRKLCTKQGRVPEHPFFDACAALELAGHALRGALDAQVHAYMHELVEYVRTELPRRSEARGVLGFDDLLLRLFEALTGPRGPALAQTVRNSYCAALIDEFQDTDPVQLEVFRRIYATGKETSPALFLIGDPKQAIYAFRGADIFAYLAASRSGIDRVHTLAVNYRSDPGVIRSVEQIFTRAQLPFVFPEIRYREVAARPGVSDACPGAALEWLLVERPDPAATKALPRGDVQSELPGRVAAEIVQLLASGTSIGDTPVAPGQIAVLCRTNAQAIAVQEALRERGVPAVLDGDASVFDSAMAEELGRWLWAMAEPADTARLRAALATQGIGYTAQDLLALERDEAAWDAWVERCHGWQQLWQARGFLRALYALCEECQVAERLLALADGERRYTDLWHLAELLHDAEQRTRKGPRALLDFYRRVRNGVASREGMALEDVQVRLESDAHAVTLTTIHKSKGLEYPVVYCPYLWASAALSSEDKRMPLFHDRQAQDRATLLLPGGTERGPIEAVAQQESLAEATRLLYVALTRAKHRLSVVWGGIQGVESSALAYLLHQRRSLAEDNAAALHAATVARVKTLTDAEIRADLQQLVAAEPDAMTVRPLRAATPVVRYQPPREPHAQLTPRRAVWPTHPALRVGSFSALVAGDGRRHQLQAPEPEALDRDALGSQPFLPLGSGDVSLAAVELEPARAPAPGSELRVALADLPAGAAFGHLVHAIYENADFRASELGLLQVVNETLTEYAADAAWAPQLAAAVYETLQTPLAPAGGGVPCLAAVASHQRLNELEFTFPVADAPLEHDAEGGEGRRALRAVQLGALLARHAQTDRERAYASQLSRLRFAPLRGFLRGFVDLVIEHEGRYYVVDYKSNRLGEHASDYQRARLEPVMEHHHYKLQYLLYSVALQRYLTLRLPAYNYEQHFGGVYYLFTRGMSPQHPPGTGILYERPSQALLDDLSLWLHAPESYT
ncbi:MAG: exodeoxyribonuclease V subunit beta [Polyangiales bacterium]